MDFGFQLFSLLMMFLLVVIYYSKLDKNVQGSKIFRCIVLIAYIMQLCSCAIYITNENIIYQVIFSKIYFILVMFWFSFYSLYYVEKFLGKQEAFRYDLKNKISWFVLFFAVLQVIGSVIVLFVPFVSSDYWNDFIIYFVCFYLLIEFFVVVFGARKIKKKDYFHLLIIFFVQSFLLFLQMCSLDLPILSIEFIFITYYTYFVLEDTLKLLLENVKLERDYALSQSIDKRGFLKNLSHEIRTPLNTIDGFSQVILDSDDLKEIKGDVEDIRLASRDLIDVINGMIDLSIIESGTLEIIEENYNVYDMIDGVCGIINAKLKDQNIEFQLKMDRDIPEVLLGDSERISQIILNLLISFIKYIDQGSIFLEVSCVKSNSKCRLKFVVKGNNIDVKREELRRVFSDENVTKGTNFGVVVSKYLISLMEGRFDVNCDCEDGAFVSVSINQKIICEKQAEKVSRKRELKPFYDSEKRILIVDDNKLNLKVASKLLLPYGVQVVDANSGQECLDILDHDINFDLILMDDLMPEMSGTETLDIIKKIERIDGYYIPIVVLTANAVSGMREKYLSAGFDDYLAKPIDKYELDRILKKYLKRRK